MRKAIWAAACLVGFLVLSACQKKEAEPIPCPIEPEHLVADMVTETEDAFGFSGLTWDMSKEDAAEALEGYALVLDDGDYCIYQADGKLKDNTPVRERIEVGFTSADGTVAGVTVQVYTETGNDNKREQMTDQLLEDLKKFESGAEVTPISPGGEGTAVVYEKESGSYVRLSSNELKEDMIAELGLEWEKAGVLSVSVRDAGKK